MLRQVYLLLSCCPCEGRISGIVDVPNACCTLAVPLAIFDRDLRPKASDDGVPPQGVALEIRGDVARAPYTGSLPITVNMCMCGASH